MRNKKKEDNFISVKYLERVTKNILEAKKKKDDYIKVRYLEYVANYGDTADKIYAKLFLVPELLNRILKNKRPEDIIPEIDVGNAKIELIINMHNHELTYKDKLLNINIVVHTERLLNGL